MRIFLLYMRIKNTLPEKAKLKWLGWDFIKNHDMKVLVEIMNDKFMSVYLRGGKKICS